MNEISALLGGLADDASRASEDVDVTRVLVHGRRRRRARTIGTGVIAVGAAGALVSGAVAAPGLLGAFRGPATPTPWGATGASSPAPTPEPSPRIELDCGPLPSALSLAVAADDVPLEVTLDYTWGVLDSSDGTFLPEGYGDILRLDILTNPAGEQPLEDAMVRITAVALVQDGVVVATVPGSDSQAPLDNPQSPAVMSLFSQPTPCDAPGATVEPGEYTAWTVLDASATVGSTTLATQRVVGPQPLRIYDFEDAANPGPTD